MPRQPAPLTAVEPDVLLSRWRIFETDGCLKRLVGYSLLDQEFVTSALVSFNQKVMGRKRATALPINLWARPAGFGTLRTYGTPRSTAPVPSRMSWSGCSRSQYETTMLSAGRTSIFRAMLSSNSSSARAGPAAHKVNS